MKSFLKNLQLGKLNSDRKLKNKSVLKMLCVFNKEST